MLSAHGVGGAQDLPIPANFAIAGAGIALTVSFAVLIVAWRTPRFDATMDGRPIAPWAAAILDAPAVALGARLVGLVLFGYFAWTVVGGPDLATNPAFGVFYVLLWVGIVPASLALGPVFKAISPSRTLVELLNRLLGGSQDGVAPLPAWVGYWPAAFGLLTFVWLELVYPGAGMMGSIRLWVGFYLAVMVTGGLIFGSRWLAAADPFEVYSTLVGHLSPIARREDGTWVLQHPLSHLDGLKSAPGLVAVVSVLLGSTAFDSFAASAPWLRFAQETVDNFTPLNTVVLLAFCAFVAGTFVAGTMATGAPPGVRRRELPGLFAPAVVPIIVGYMVAHYLTLFVENGQLTLIQLSDPMVNGSDLLGTAAWEINYFLTEHPTLLASIKVIAVLAGHVIGVVASHDRAMRLLSEKHRVSGQLPLLFVMVCYTVGGLFLLFNS